MQKNKLLILTEILKQESDAEHPITTNALIDKLSSYGISCDRRTLARDISQLQQMNYPIKNVKVIHSNAFYMEQHNFSIAELKIIIDAIQASAVIPEETTNALTEKIANLGGSHCAELLQHNRIRFNVRKQTNNNVLNSIAIIEESFKKQTQISFLYFKHDKNGNRVYQRHGKRYVVDPIALIYTDDNYYLRCYNQARADYRNYRIDRMDDVQHLDTYIGDEAMVSAEELATYTCKTIKMYGGEETDLVLEFTESLIDVVFDQFGLDTKIEQIENNLYTTTVKVQISNTFWGWFFQFPDQMRIVSPEAISIQCQEWALKALHPKTKEV